MVQQKRGPGRPKKELPEDDDLIGDLGEDTAGAEEAPGMALDDVWGGVSASWLYQVFGGDRNVVKKKLAEGNCKVVGKLKGAPLYSLKEAAAVLVPPKVDIEAYMRRLRPNDLPPLLQATYWDGQLKHQKWAENAGDLWRTEAVMTVLGDLFIDFRTTVNLWVEEVERAHGLTTEQRTTVVALSDKLLESVYQRLVEAPNRSQTPSSLEQRHDAEEVPDGV